MIRNTKLFYLTLSFVFYWGVVCAPAHASEIEDWKPLNGTSIKKALENQKVQYPNEGGARQEFHTNGSTVYIENGPSFGSWRTSDSQYCSVWPPASSWVCYQVFISLDQRRIRFIGDSGRIYEGVFVP